MIKIQNIRRMTDKMTKRWEIFQMSASDLGVKKEGENRKVEFAYGEWFVPISVGEKIKVQKS